SASSAFGIYLTFYLLKTLSQDTYVWIISFFSDTLNLINGDATGNYTQLGMQLPKDNLLFGYGFRIYDLNTILSNITIYQRSDIGYANDLFLGGIVYIILLYIPILFYVYLSTANDNKFKGTGLSFFLVIALLIADYKGETMRNGNLLLLVITLSMLFRIPKRKKEIDER
ncbi:polysaccharide polymerase, partial [Leuconostoc suionicum]